MYIMLFVSHVRVALMLYARYLTLGYTESVSNNFFTEIK